MGFRPRGQEAVGVDSEFFFFTTILDISTAKKHCLDLEAKAKVLTKIPDISISRVADLHESIPPIKLSCQIPSLSG